MSAVPRAFASFLAAVLVLVPLPWHWRARNIPTLSLIIWLFAINVAHGVNVILWYDNVQIKLLVWCDIVSKLVIGANMALPAACFCLTLRLEGIAAVRHANSTHPDKRRRMLVDAFICFGVPCIYMALHYIVQGHRFDIVEDFGCQPDSYVSLPEFFLVWFVPILSCLGTCIFGGMAFMHFFRRRATFARHLAMSNSGLTPSRYFRLMTMSLALVLWDLVVFTLTLRFNYRNGLRPWTGWADVHWHWLNINRFPITIVPNADKVWLYFVWWTIPVTAYIFFAFFAFGRDASAEYGACVRWVRRHIFRQNPDAKAAKPLESFGKFVASSPCPPRLRDLGIAESKIESPLSPVSMAYSRLSWPATPSTRVSTTSSPSSLSFVDKGLEAYAALPSPADDPSPPYPLSTTESQVPAVIFPPPPAVAREGHAIVVPPHAHTHQIV